MASVLRHMAFSDDFLAPNFHNLLIHWHQSHILVHICRINIIVLRTKILPIHIASTGYNVIIADCVSVFHCGNISVLKIPNFP